MDLNVPYNKQLQMEMTIEYKEEPIKTQLVYKTDIKPVQENNKNHDIIIQSEKSERFITQESFIGVASKSISKRDGPPTPKASKNNYLLSHKGGVQFQNVNQSLKKLKGKSTTNILGKPNILVQNIDGESKPRAESSMRSKSNMRSPANDRSAGKWVLNQDKTKMSVSDMINSFA